MHGKIDDAARREGDAAAGEGFTDREVVKIAVLIHGCLPLRIILH